MFLICYVQNLFKFLSNFNSVTCKLEGVGGWLRNGESFELSVSWNIRFKVWFFLSWYQFLGVMFTGQRFDIYLIHVKGVFYKISVITIFFYKFNGLTCKLVALLTKPFTGEVWNQGVLFLFCFLFLLVMLNSYH